MCTRQVQVTIPTPRLPVSWNPLAMTSMSARDREAWYAKSGKRLEKAICCIPWHSEIRSTMWTSAAHDARPAITEIHNERDLLFAVPMTRSNNIFFRFLTIGLSPLAYIFIYLAIFLSTIAFLLLLSLLVEVLIVFLRDFFSHRAIILLFVILSKHRSSAASVAVRVAITIPITSSELAMVSLHVSSAITLGMHGVILVKIRSHGVQATGPA
mmetsp:Transcript_1680/g.3105  ORF Transcript_1680/g.3105 Transcript_1680/m.3105 type:complete len:212 (-) Transcript_1680:155-790(-)